MKKFLFILFFMWAVFLPVTATAGDGVIEVFGATCLTGGTTGCLDSPTVAQSADLDTGDMAMVGVIGGYFYFYTYNSTSSAAENSPTVIKPDDNAGSGRWLLTSVYSAATGGSVLSVNGETGNVVLSQDDIGDGTTYKRTHNDFTDTYKSNIETNNAKVSDQTVALTAGSGCTITGTYPNFTIGFSGSSMVYPSAGVANSTGSGWGASYTVGTGANNLVQLDASSRLPAVDGSQLTNLPEAYTLPTATAAILGGVKIGDRLSITPEGFLSADVQAGSFPGFTSLDHDYGFGTSNINISGVITSISSSAIPHTTPSNGDTTHFANNDELYDWIMGLGFVTGTPWTSEGYITGIDGTDVTTALGYTPLQSSDLSGYATESWVGLQGFVTGTPWTLEGYLTAETDPLSLHTADAGDIYTHDAADFATAAQGALADTALQAVPDLSDTYLPLHSKADTAGNADTVTNGVYTSDCGTGPNDIVQLTPEGKLPAVDGSLLTNLPAGFANPMTTAYDLIYANGFGTTARLPVGDPNTLLGVDGDGVLGYLSTFSLSSISSGVKFCDTTDATKTAQFDLSGLTTGTNYPLLWPAVSGTPTIATRSGSFTNGDLAIYQDGNFVATTNPTLTGMTTSGNIVLTTTGSKLCTDTTDGSDNKSIIISGVGGAPAKSRGAYASLNGNETASYGSVYVVTGNGDGGSNMGSLNLIADSGKIYLATLGVAGSANMSIDANNLVTKTSSSRRYKKDIEPLRFDSSLIYDLTPKSFVWKSNGKRDFGFIAEEAYKVLPDIVTLDNEGRPEGVEYANLTAPIIKQMQILRLKLEVAYGLIGILFLGFLYLFLQVRKIKKQI